MSSLVLTGSTSGTVSVQAPAVAGSNTATIGAATGTHYPFTAGTAVASTSGTSIDFTGIPSWVKRITVMLQGVSTSGSSFLLMQLGVSGTPETTGYTSVSQAILSSSVSQTTSTAGFTIYQNSATYSQNGAARFTNITGNTWVAEGTFANTTTTAYSATVAGSKGLAGVLNMIRITTVNGTDTFDAGSINILYE